MQKNNEALYAQIDRYLSGQLPEAESAAMRQALLNDAELAQEVELRRLEFEVSEALIGQRIRDQMQRLRTDPPPDEPQNMRGQKTRARRFSLPAWVIAAMLIIAAIGIYWWAMRMPSLPAEGTKADPAPPAEQPSSPPTQADQPASPPQANGTPAPVPNVPPATAPTGAARRLALATELYRDPNFETLRGANPNSGDPFEAASAAWQKRDWAAVLSVLGKVAASDPQYIRAQAFIGHAQFKLKRFGAATQTFTAVSDSRIQPWAEEADWYLLLALLANGKEEEAVFRVRLGQLLSDTGHPYFAEAERLQKKLGR